MGTMVPEESVYDADAVLEYTMNSAVEGMALKFESEGACGYNWADKIKFI
jgi:hypothetical protein